MYPWLYCILSFLFLSFPNVLVGNPPCIPSPLDSWLLCIKILFLVNPSKKFVFYFVSSFLHIVDILKGIYAGQTPIKLVKRNMMAIIPKIIAAVPVIELVKYSTAITIAKIILIIRSMLPIFFFIMFLLILLFYVPM